MQKCKHNSLILLFIFHYIINKNYTNNLLFQIQFVIVAVHGIMGLLSTNCSFPKFVIALTIPQDIIMFILFWKFYKKTYTQPKNKLT